MSRSIDWKRYVANLRADYPDAGPAGSGAPYCVGGAFCMDMGPAALTVEPFPSHYAVAAAASLLTRGDYGGGDLWRVARALTEANDAGDIDGAWDALAQLLTIASRRSRR